jgi:hypothetical protein
MANTFTLIGTVTVGSGGANTIVFNSIPASYTDLQLFGSVKSSRNANNDFVKGYFNADTTDANYDGYLNYNTVSAGTGSTFSGAGAPRYFGECNGNPTNNTYSFSALSIYIPNYAGSTTKAYTTESGQLSNTDTTQLISYATGRWSGTAAITDLTFFPGVTGPWLQYSTISLYGIKGSN